VKARAASLAVGRAFPPPRGRASQPRCGEASPEFAPDSRTKARRPAVRAGLQPRLVVWRSRASALLAGLLLLSACGAPDTAARRPASASPTRIVSLVPAATEMLFIAGAGERMVAVSTYDHYPPQVDTLTRVGSLLDPDMERIIALKPDLAIVFEGQVELREKLSQAGIPLFVYPRPTLADIFRTLRALGARVGRAEQANREAAALERQLDAVRERVKGLPRPQTMLVIGREPGTLRNIYVSGGVGFLNDVLDIAGGGNVFANVARENLQVTTEAILTAQPEAIVEVVASQPWSPEQIARETRVWDVLGSLPAVHHRRIALLVGDEFVIPGPRVVQAATRLAEVLHHQ